MPRVAPTQSALPSVTTIIAARNEAENLPGLLEDLVAQEYAGEFSCVIADDRSTDQTWAIINKFAKTHSWCKAVRVLEQSTTMSGKKNALTQCIKQTQAQLLLETDADCRLGPGWVAGMAGQFETQTGIVVGLSTVAGATIFAKYQAMDFMGIMLANAGMLNQGKTWSGSGQNLGFRRTLFTAIGGFTGDAGQSIGDDFYLVQQIGKLPGVRADIAWDPASFVETAPAESLAAFYRQRVRWAADTRGLWHADPLFFSFLLAAFILNLALLLSLLTLQTGALFWGVVALKGLLELLVTGYGFRTMGRLQDMWLFIPWFIVQPLYIPVMGLAGLFGKVTWK